MCMPFTISDLDLSSASVSITRDNSISVERGRVQMARDVGVACPSPSLEYPWFDDVEDVRDNEILNREGEVEPSQPVVDSSEMVECMVATKYVELIRSVVRTADNFKEDEIRDPRSVDDAMHFYNLMCDLANNLGHTLRCTDARRDYDTIFFKDTSTGCEYMLKRC